MKTSIKTTVFDGKALSKKYLTQVRDYTKKLRTKPKLATVLVGNDEASSTYVNIKQKTCKDAGINVDVYRPSTKNEILGLIGKLNKDKSVNGILVQLPLPSNMSEQEIIKTIDPAKDVDGLHPYNIGRLAYGDETLPACTPYGIIKIIENSGINLEGMNVVILGRGIHVGKPLCSMLINRNATVTLCHTKTKNLQKFTKEADMVIIAIGKPKYLSGEMIKEGAFIIDVGMNRIGGKLVGDADSDSVKNKAAFITPVPGGVGPMTVAMLARNVVSAYKFQNKLQNKL